MREDYLKSDDEDFSSADKEIEKALRPLSFDDFTGQEKIVDNLKIFVEAASQRSEPLDHVLLHGPPGLGKTTLANALSTHYRVNFAKEFAREYLECNGPDYNFEDVLDYYDNLNW